MKIGKTMQRENHAEKPSKPCEIMPVNLGNSEILGQSVPVGRDDPKNWPKRASTRRKLGKALSKRRFFFSGALRYLIFYHRNSGILCQNVDPQRFLQEPCNTLPVNERSLTTQFHVKVERRMRATSHIPC